MNNETKQTVKTEREQWEEDIKSKYPKCELHNTGTYIYATLDGADVGMFSIVGNYGKVN